MLLIVSKHGFFWSEENVNLNYFPTQDGVTVLVCPVILWTLKYIVIFYGRCYAMFFGNGHALTDVIAKLTADDIAMLCMVDVTTTRQMV